MSKKENAEAISFPPSKILVPIDGSLNAKRALKTGILLSKTYHAELIVITIIPTPSMLLEAPAGLGVTPLGASSYYEQQENYAEHFIDEAMEVAKKHGAFKIRSEIGRAAKSIVEEIIEVAAREKIDLIVIGTRGLGGFRKLLQGSVSSGVMTHAHCNVLVVR
ncbi:MAG: universal stress protein [Thaumarchaeota archaeon]|nr:universal stress protein [Nitrososphaerota archaeon]